MKKIILAERIPLLCCINDNGIQKKGHIQHTRTFLTVRRGSSMWWHRRSLQVHLDDASYVWKVIPLWPLGPLNLIVFTYDQWKMCTRLSQVSVLTTDYRTYKSKKITRLVCCACTQPPLNAQIKLLRLFVCDQKKMKTFLITCCILLNPLLVCLQNSKEHINRIYIEW